MTSDRCPAQNWNLRYCLNAGCDVVRAHHVTIDDMKFAAVWAWYRRMYLPDPIEGDDRFHFTGTREVAEAAPMRGWRAWAARDTTKGPLLLAPYRPQPGFPAAVWQPGMNTASQVQCWAKHCPLIEEHPNPHCHCGIRAMTSIPSLLAFYAHQREHQKQLLGPLEAVAEVELWGKLCGPAEGDDWERTVRASHARIVGPLYAADHHEALAEHYDVEVLPLEKLTGA